ncbi:MAG: 2-amino-4-hydroxy-6-hydroxymethyldihydropteridine diphosphokinase [candidate division Zixibacteria bacterium]|jgi:2-amino-4-hydroxy-6-hydroxymethyldihydropteridine diphosphokinase|nr:2-amino-4-hydroxy-6-hydroxymethyldihydropteridine diphosphokinase [candidate division Zixibacteria bacterium]
MADTVYLLLGSNLGNRERHMQVALDKLQSLEGLEVIATSPVYLSDAVGMPDGSPSFLNQVVKCEYLYPPHELLHSVEKIEAAMGRTDKGTYQSRIIDIDILLFGDRVLQLDDLTVPHPSLLERPFALIPLLAIDPELVDPRTGTPLESYVDSRDRERVLLYKDHVARNV